MNTTLAGPEITTGYGDREPDETGDDWMGQRIDEARDRMLLNQSEVADLLMEMDGGIRVGVLSFADTWDAIAWMLAHKEDAPGIRCVLRAIEAKVATQAERVCRDAVIAQAEREVAARMAEMKQDAEIDRRWFS